MNLPKLSDLNVKGKKALLRLDLDVPLIGGRVVEDERLEISIPTIKYLLENGCKQIIVLGHLGRPQGKDLSLSLRPVEKRLRAILNKEKVDDSKIVFEENLRFDPGEDNNNPEFAQKLAEKGDVYVDDAFGVCHRETASIVGLPEQFKSKFKNAVAAGFHLQQEIENLTRILENPNEPVVFVVAGGKRDKAIYIEKLLDKAEFVLVGGKLAQGVSSYCREKDGRSCIVAAHLTVQGNDITPDSARNFTKIIQGAGTIVWNGPMGDIDNGFWEGTEIVAQSVAEVRGFRVAGGGDTIHALHKLKLSAKMDFISTGGGAMLEFLSFGDLPGLAALRQK